MATINFNLSGGEHMQRIEIKLAYWEGQGYTPIPGQSFSVNGLYDFFIASATLSDDNNKKGFLISGVLTLALPTNKSTYADEGSCNAKEED